jgi:GntR family transcriptional regulator, transcriptional repressor for pyruvate dehydrogenase complex
MITGIGSASKGARVGPRYNRRMPIRKGPACEAPDITAELIDRFKQLIAQGTLFPGCKLPPERELAKALAVSRAALRQALKALAMMGVVSQRIGDGTYMKPDAGSILSRPFDFLVLLDDVSLDELMEARMMVEPDLSAKAAQRATVDDLELIRRALRPIRPFSREKMMEQDLAFDQGIFRAARNRICERIFPLLHQTMFASIHVTYRLVDWDYTLKFHEPIYQAIEQRQPDEARERMMEHLQDVWRLLKEAAARPRSASVPKQSR